MKLYNLTPHVIRIHINDDQYILLPSIEWRVPRVALKRRRIGNLSVGGLNIPVTEIERDRLVNLPHRREGIGYIVSRVVAEEAKRDDFYFPDAAIRNEEGVIVGCRGLGQVKHDR